jgi:putative oxidoreductase
MNASRSIPRGTLISTASVIVGQAYRRLDRVPYWLLALPLRVAVAWVFWSSAMTHLANWETTLDLFETEYALPFLPPHPSAYLAVAIELSTPPLLVLGLLTRPVATVLLGMTVVIEVFVYPLAWPTHIQWAAMLLVLLCRGPGKLSVDWLIGRYLLAADRTENRE